MKIEIFTTAQREYTWRLKASNGEILCQSYNPSVHLDTIQREIEFVKKHIKEAEVVIIE